MLANRFQTVQFILIAGLVVLLAFSPGSAGGVTTASAAELQAAPSLAAVPGGPGYIMVPATAFIAESPTTAYTVFWGELSVPASSPNPVSFFNAAVYLPQGAKLTGITLFYNDTTADSLTLGVDLKRKPLPSLSSGENVGLSVYSNLTGWGQYQSDTAPDPTRAIVDNSQYSYWLSLYIYAAPVYLQVQAVRIDYSYGTNLPLVIR